ncbi:hypothetical protein GCM10009612_02330 [Streptomyces beijiangensis]
MGHNLGHKRPRAPPPEYGEGALGARDQAAEEPLDALDELDELVELVGFEAAGFDSEDFDSAGLDPEADAEAEDDAVAGVELDDEPRLSFR